MIVILDKPATDEDIQKAREHYPDYIKITIDIDKEIIAIGGEYHYDAEQLLLRDGSSQKNIWGGGVNIKTGKIFCNAIINMRPSYKNGSQEILDEQVRKRFVSFIRKYISNYAKE